MFGFFGNLASVVGLVVSAFAAFFAKRASAAAREARDAALRQSLSEDMNDAARLAGDIVMYLRTEKPDVALLRITDLKDKTSYLSGRWENQLLKKSKDNLSIARERLRFMHGS
jgi:hypothetical protein